jgi:hypothetical protein
MTLALEKEAHAAGESVSARKKVAEKEAAQWGHVLGPWKREMYGSGHTASCTLCCDYVTVPSVDAYKKRFAEPYHGTAVGDRPVHSMKSGKWGTTHDYCWGRRRNDISRWVAGEVLKDIEEMVTGFVGQNAALFAVVFQAMLEAREYHLSQEERVLRWIRQNPECSEWDVCRGMDIRSDIVEDILAQLKKDKLVTTQKKRFEYGLDAAVLPAYTAVK